MVARDLSSSARTRLSCSILAIIRSISLLPAVPVLLATLPTLPTLVLPTLVALAPTLGCEWLLVTWKSRPIRANHNYCNESNYGHWVLRYYYAPLIFANRILSRILSRILFFLSFSGRER